MMYASVELVPTKMLPDGCGDGSPSTCDNVACVIVVGPEYVVGGSTPFNAGTFGLVSMLFETVVGPAAFVIEAGRGDNCTSVAVV